MSMAANLIDAASLTSSQLFIIYELNALKNRMTNFSAGLRNANTFPDDVPNNRPVGNWLVVVDQIANAMSTGKPGLVPLDNAVQAIYRICRSGAQMQTQGLITAAQGTALLNQWNTMFGT